MVGDTSAESSLCIRDLRPEQEPVPPDSTTWPKRLFQRAGLQELMLRKAVMWMPRLCRSGTGGGGEDVGTGPWLAACLGPQVSAVSVAGEHEPRPAVVGFNCW